MKNFLVVGILFFSLVSFAQKTTQATLTSPQTTKSAGIDVKKVESNLEELSTVLTLTEQQRESFKELFTTKYRLLNEATGGSEERKEIIYQTIARKIEASIPADQFEKLKANKEVFHNITH
ncbi:hypothetical protein [Flavobacterium aurantiibacter]|uniref:DUF4168 domain-containing protein n=1 Tax=Flavobacterium aurantiibacter TaxID=2023067 RepID=A0A255ZNM8_9FLAO|nr:hypothetical protein [Flavobacterium aurantiibacter]OYQ43177.1 hypothetical protein CHX27_10605 [Flavobacterium aurantiibacter]